MRSTSFDFDAYLQTLTQQPGVYRFIDAERHVIYVGKARNLKKRVSSYFVRGDISPKNRVMLANTDHIEVTVTSSENEALLLECHLIKTLRPKYNVLLRDDKSYPYIFISKDGAYPRMDLHRGAHKAPGRYFGPYPSAGAARESLNLLQKLFGVRQCKDSFFKHRARPCLQYQIKRCNAPCVKYIDEATYAQDVANTVLFLEGKSQAIIDDFIQRMNAASARQDYETAAIIRDQIQALSKVQEQQHVFGGKGDADVVACAKTGDLACIDVMTFRGGRLLGHKVYFPKLNREETSDVIMASFLTQYYLGNQQLHDIPHQILVSTQLEEQAWVMQTLSESAGRRVSITANARGERAKWLQLCMTNAKAQLAARLSSQSTMVKRFEQLSRVLELDSTPARIECFDISHTMGEATVASCVVFENTGPVKSDYRRFNIKGITPGDDYAAMHQALTRRYIKIKQGDGVMPDVLFIDGGKGQLNQALDVLENLQVSGVTVIGVAKGPKRKVGLETLYLQKGTKQVTLNEHSGVFHLILQVRDEAHRFAITGHRTQRAKARVTSHLEDIAGIGPVKRRALLTHLGGLAQVRRASIDTLARVPGISQQLAEQIYAAFHLQEDK